LTPGKKLSMSEFFPILPIIPAGMCWGFPISQTALFYDDDAHSPHSRLQARKHRDYD
jgi:hypothetical protein